MKLSNLLKNLSQLEFNNDTEVHICLNDGTTIPVGMAELADGVILIHTKFDHE